MLGQCPPSDRTGPLRESGRPKRLIYAHTQNNTRTDTNACPRRATHSGGYTLAARRQIVCCWWVTVPFIFSCHQSPEPSKPQPKTATAPSTSTSAFLERVTRTGTQGAAGKEEEEAEAAGEEVRCPWAGLAASSRGDGLREAGTTSGLRSPQRCACTTFFFSAGGGNACTVGSLAGGLSPPLVAAA